MDIIERIKALYVEVSASPSAIIAIAVSVLAFTLLYYFLIQFLFKNGANEIVWIFVATMLVGAGVVTFVDTLNSAIYLLIPAMFLMLIFILYSVELKRIVWERKNLKLLDVKRTGEMTYDEEKIKKCINEIIKALQNMSKNDIGAIIVLSTGNVPTQITDSGIMLDSDISSELIESVFFPKTPLHDGAMIINETKIVAAGCFLPLSQKIDNIPKDLGTRHRAGIGVTETIDVISLIVSEETGVISIARGGKITRYANAEMLKNVLSQYYWQEI